MSDILVKNNKLEFQGKTYNCAIGKAGFSANKHEGDNCTPLGEFALREVLYRADKITKPVIKLPIKTIHQDDGWCDAPDDKNYNRQIKLPYSVSHENLYRDDNIYDIIVPLGYNDNPVVNGKGSAIFLHIARPDYSGTEGCVALAYQDLLEVLATATPDTKIIISQ